MFALQEISWLKTPGFGTKICVLNHSLRDMFLPEGRPADEIMVTGNPAFDSIFAPEIIKAGCDLRKSRGWGYERFTILYSSTPELERHPSTGEVGDSTLSYRGEQHLREIIFNRPDLELVLRRHPSKDQEIAQGDRTFTSC